MAVYKSSKPTKDGRQYFFRIKYNDIFGETHDYSSPKFKNKKDAENEEALYRIKIQNQKASISNITIKQIYNTWIIDIQKKVKEQTIQDYHSLFKKIQPIENLAINKLTVTKYKQFINNIDKQKYSVGYINRIIKLLKRIIVYSNKYYNTSIEILKFIEYYSNANSIPEKLSFFTYDEYLKFDSVITNYEDHVIFELLYFLGLRIGECQALTWKDIDFQNETISITKNITKKCKNQKWTISSPKTSSSIRTLPITNKIKKDLLKLQEEKQKYSDYKSSWFLFGNVRPINLLKITEHKNKYCELSNVPKIKIHDFRHSCASLLINQGASIALVSKYLGHSNITTTLNIYTHMYKSELDKMTNILNKL